MRKLENKELSLHAQNGHPNNIRTVNGITILWDPIKLGYILPGYGKKRVSEEVARAFAVSLEIKYGHCFRDQTLTFGSCA